MESTPTPFEALQAAVAQVGTQVRFAALCGVSQPAVWKWLQSSKRLPPEHVLTVERETGISKHLLRPDIFGASPADLSTVAAGASPGQCDPAPISHRGEA